jgi:hypothetical protein
MSIGRVRKAGGAAAGARVRTESTTLYVGASVAALHPGLRRADESIRDLLAPSGRHDSAQKSAPSAPRLGDAFRVGVQAHSEIAARTLKTVLVLVFKANVTNLVAVWHG